MKLKAQNINLGACILMLTLFFSCAKEMEERLPENAEQEIHKLALFEEEVVLETQDVPATPFKISSNNVETELLAINEFKQRPVKMIKGPARLSALFKDLMIESQKPGEIFEVVFKLTDSRVSAFYKAQGHEVSEGTRQILLTSRNGESLAPLFHYSGVSYGLYKKRLNSIDEPTRFLDFEKSNKSAATHVNFTATPENRKRDGLYAKTDEPIMLKSKLDNRAWSAFELTQFLDISNIEQTQSFLTQNSQFVYSKIIDNMLFIYKLVPKSELSAIEESFLNKNDLRVHSCDEHQKRSSTLKAEDCIAKAVMSLEIGHVRLKLETDNSELVGSVEIEENANPRSTQLVKVPLQKQVQVYRFKDEAQITDTENVFRKRHMENRVHSAKKMAQALNMEEIQNLSFIKTKLMGNHLMVLVPTARKDLSVYEYDAYLSGDPRFESCPQEVVSDWAQDDECIMASRYFRNVTYSRLRLDINQNNQLRDVSVEENVERQKADILRLNNQGPLGHFEYDREIRQADDIVKHKEVDFDLDAEYLYIPMTYGTPREVVAADPFYKGSEKIVKLRFAREGLEVYEPEKDDRFQNNALNDKPVLFIPGEHKSFKCSEDNYGDCTLSTTANNDLTWQQRKIFSPQLDKLEVKEVNSLDLFTLESDPCLTNTDTEMVNHTIENGVINIELEKTYKTSTSWRCIAELYFDDTVNMTGFSNAGFKVQFHYSLVRLDDLIDPNYQPIAYPIQEHGTFGFFKNLNKRLGDFFDSRRQDESYLLNRWSTNRTKLVYHLSETFNEPGQELIKKATYDAVDGMNKALSEAKAGFKIVLKESKNAKPGDLRKNVIQLITDPLSNGLLGYAPTVTNPRTGEIVHGHINMYSGVVKSMTRRVWDNMVAHTKRKYEKELKEQKTFKKSLLGTRASNMENFNHKEIRRAQEVIKSQPNQAQLKNIKLDLFAQHSDASKALGQANHNRLLNKIRRPRRNNYVEREELTELEKRYKLEEERLDRWSRNNAYAVEFFKIAHTVKAVLPGIKNIPGVLDSRGVLLSWSDLNDKQKKAASDIIVPHAYTSTFVHEMGHNLGLRHNFAGSFDADNFYTKEEAKSRGLRHAPAYSSIMDYAYSEMNESTIFGKYDIAALRFAYAREVELKNGAFVKVPETLTELEKELGPKARKYREDENQQRQAGNDEAADEAARMAEKFEFREYRFCTDSNAGLSASCNRFDEGSTLVEVGKHLIQRYEDSYHTLNFRNGRNEFKDSNLLNITLWNMRHFENIRDLFEDWEFYADIFGQDLLVQGCGPEDLARYPVCKDINDRKEAAELAGQFFLNVLKTPDHTCLVIDKDDNTKTTHVNLREFYEDEMQYDYRYDNYIPKSCFEKPVIDRVDEVHNAIVFAEAGKYLNEIRGNSDTQIYADDREVIGTWQDKVLAMKALVQREKAVLNTETGHMSLAEHPTIANGLTQIMNHLLLGSPLANPVAFKGVDGNSYRIPYQIKDTIVESPGDQLYGLKRFLGLSTDSGAQTELIRPLLHMLSGWSITDDLETKQESYNFHNLYAVRKSGISNPITGQYFEMTRINDFHYSATSDNVYAYQMIDSMNSLSELKGIAQSHSETLERVISERLNATLPDTLSELQIDAAGLNENLLGQLVQLKEQGAELSLELLQRRFGDELGSKILEVYTTLSTQELAEVQQALANLGNIVPDDADEIESKLYQYTKETLVDFQEGQLEKDIQYYGKVLKLMPQHKHH